MADVELIFPAKRVHIKPFQLVQLLVTAATALVTGALMVYKVRGPRRWPGRVGGEWAVERLCGTSRGRQRPPRTLGRTRAHSTTLDHAMLFLAPLLQAGKDINMNLVWTAGSLVATRCFQVRPLAFSARACSGLSATAQRRWGGPCC